MIFMERNIPRTSCIFSVGIQKKTGSCVLLDSLSLRCSLPSLSSTTYQRDVFRATVKTLSYFAASIESLFPLADGENKTNKHSMVHQISRLVIISLYEPKSAIIKVPKDPIFSW